MALTLAALAATKSNITCPEPLVTNIVQIVAEGVRDSGSDVELTADQVVAYWDETHTFPPQLQHSPQPLAWVEYPVGAAMPVRSMVDAVGRHLRQVKQKVVIPHRCAVAFAAFNDLGPDVWWTDKMVRNVTANGHTADDVSHTVLAVTSVAMEQQNGLFPISVAATAFDAGGEHLGNFWFLLNNGTDDDAGRLVDHQVDRQGMPSSIYLSSPGWDAYARMQ